jgi:ATP-dependent protease ClpP protease subunit
MPKPRTWFSLQARTDDSRSIVELRIYDEIGFWGVTAKQFVDDLHNLASNADEVLVSVNSPGGDVFDAFAIYNALRRYTGKVVTRVDGVAASSASLVVMAGDQIIMPENAMLMIHNPWTVAVGCADDLRHTAEMMDKARDGIMGAYQSKSGQDQAELIGMMDAETWLTALEAQALGMCDVIEEPVRLSASARSVELFAKFSRAPEGLRNLLDAAEPTTPSTDAATPAPKPKTAPTGAHGSAEPVAKLVSHVIASCRKAQIANLSDAVLLTCGLKSREEVDTRVAEAREIAGLCVAARLPDRAPDMVAAGLSVEQVRARLFDNVVNGAGERIDNHQRETPTAPAVTAAASIYAARGRARRAA